MNRALRNLCNRQKRVQQAACRTRSLPRASREITSDQNTSATMIV